MTSRHEAGFFATRRRWSRIKHGILGYYLVPWPEKLGSTHRTIHVVDPFAGAGKYGDPSRGAEEEGSPVIAVRRAEAYEWRHPGRRMQVICVEHNKAHFASLRSCIGASPARPVLLRGEFHEHVASMVQMIGRDPALILLDPIGLKSIDAATCRPLLQRGGPSDFLIIVHLGVVHRVGGMLDSEGKALERLPKAYRLAATIDGVFGTSEWRSVAIDNTLSTEEKDGCYLDIYFVNLLGPRYRYKCAYPVKSEYWGGTKYWLVHASDHRDGIELMNDAIVAVDDDLFRSAINKCADSEYLPQMAAIPVDERHERRHDELRRRLVAVVTAKGGSVRFGDLRDQVFGEFFGRVRIAEYARAVKTLVREGALRRTERVAAKLRDAEVITLA